MLRWLWQTWCSQLLLTAQPKIQPKHHMLCSMASHVHKRFVQRGSWSHVFSTDLMQAVWWRWAAFSGLLCFSLTRNYVGAGALAAVSLPWHSTTNHWGGCPGHQSQSDGRGFPLCSTSMSGTQAHGSPYAIGGILPKTYQFKDEPNS